MSGNGTTDRDCLADLNQAQDYYNQHKLHKCIELCRDLLADDAIPRWHRIKTLILLGGTLGDRPKAADCLEEAQALWEMVYVRTTRGDDLRIDQGLVEMKRELKELAAVLAIEAREQELKEQAAAHLASCGRSRDA